MCILFFFWFQEAKKEQTFGLVIPGKSLVSNTFSFSFSFSPSVQFMHIFLLIGDSVIF